MICWWRKTGEEFAAASHERRRSKVGRTARLRGRAETVAIGPERQAMFEAERGNLSATMRAEEKSGRSPSASPAPSRFRSVFSCFRAFCLPAVLPSVGFEAMPQQLVELHAVLGGVGL